MLDQYFASVSTDDIGDELQAKVDKYYKYLTSSSLVDLWRRSYYAYYGLAADGARTGFGMFDIGTIQAKGAEGEIAHLKVNRYRNLLTHLLVITTQDRPALECRAINSDSASIAQAYLGDGILDYFFREKKIETNHRDAIETALVFSIGYVRLDWDATAGKTYGVGPNGAPVYDGDIVAKTYNPFDVAIDVTATSPGALKWYICRDPTNRYDLAAKYPNLADDILKVSTDTISSRQDPTKIIPSAGIGTEDSDLIDKYEFLHEPTPAVPTGRYTVFLQGGLVLFDGPLPFRKVPVYRVTPFDLIGTPFGFTVAFDLLGPQEAIDKLHSVALTNAMGQGVNNFWSPPGNEVTKSQLGGGANLLESPIKPEVLQLLNTSPEIFSYRQQLEGDLNTLSGISAVSQGQVPDKDMSGAALALLAAQSVTFNSGLQNSSNQLLEGLGTGIINILKDFAATPRLATITGSFNRPLMKQYVGKDLANIDRVVVEATSATSKTTAGKIAIAKDLLSTPGMITTPQEYLEVVNTGNLTSMFEGQMAEIMNIKAENEWMQNGKPPRVIRTDDHALHIAEHKAILANPESREDTQLVNIVLAHITEHEQLQQQQQLQEPEFLAATKRPPLPYPQPSAPPPQPQGNPGAGPSLAPQVAAPNPAAAQANVKPSNLPNLPKGADPKTQQSYAAMTGK